MNMISNTLILVCIIFALYFILVVCLDAKCMLKDDIEKGVKYNLPLWKIECRYLKKSFWYHFPKL